MATKYYTNLFEIEDTYRSKKYQTLLLSSLKNDMQKWSEEIPSSGEKARYSSPDYNGSNFQVEFRGKYTAFAYVSHNIKNTVIAGRNSELITESFSGELEQLVLKLRETIYTPEIYEIENAVGNQNNRKEKLQFLDLEQIKEIVEDTYQDWLKSDNIVTAKMIAKLIYSYRRKEEISKLWTDKFENIELINNELKKLKG